MFRYYFHPEIKQPSLFVTNEREKRVFFIFDTKITINKINSQCKKKNTRGNRKSNGQTAIHMYLNTVLINNNNNKGCAEPMKNSN